jgi:hypothetical protein
MGDVVRAVKRLLPGQGFSGPAVIETESDYSQMRWAVGVDSGGSTILANSIPNQPTWAEIEAQFPIIEWDAVRSERGRRIQSCDWTRLDDVPLDPGKKEEWETYRQQLRDITDQPDPFNINWPTPPE